LDTKVPKTQLNYKIAVLISGGLRNFRVTQPWINKFLIEPLNADVFVHGWQTNEGYDSDVESVRKYLNIKDYIINDRDLFKIPIPDVMNHKYPDHVRRGWGMEVADHILGQLFNMKNCFNLIENYQKQNGFTYDIIIRIRPDEFWFDTIKDDDLDYIVKNRQLATPQHYISVISGNNINDRFAMGSFEVMSEYCSMFDHVEFYAQLAGNDEATEFYTNHHIRNVMRIPIRDIDITFMLEYPGDSLMERGFDPTNMRHLTQNDSNVAIHVANEIKNKNKNK
jgi:hypothetical protein